MPRLQRHVSIEDALRQRIRSAQYAAGSRIPTHRDLEGEFAASPMTVQRAIDRLVDQGYLIARGSRGTFVNEHLPHQTCCAIIFPDDPGGSAWNRFWSTLLREAKAWHDPQGNHFAVYSIRDGDLGGAEHQRLCRDAADGSLAAVLFASRPFFLAGSPILSSALPRTVLGIDVDEVRRGMSVIDMDLDIGRLWRTFAGDRRRRLAVISNRAQTMAWRDNLPALHALGITTRAEWWIDLPTAQPGALSAQRVAHLLLSGRADERPDALLIGDDNLVPPATAGILDAGLNPPADLSVIAHANFPGPTPSAVNCRRFGPDIPALLGSALAELARLREPEAKPRSLRFEMAIREMAANSAS